MLKDELCNSKSTLIVFLINKPDSILFLIGKRILGMIAVLQKILFWELVRLTSHVLLILTLKYFSNWPTSLHIHSHHPTPGHYLLSWDNCAGFPVSFLSSFPKSFSAQQAGQYFSFFFFFFLNLVKFSTPLLQAFR